jgi:SAM-dependent methyltransferase
MTAKLQASYDEFPYLSLPFPQSHPDRMATLGRLHGLRPAPVDECRVLEIGCASGGNLIPMAAALPRSRFTGIDFSSVQVRQGAADVATLGLGNIDLVPMDLLDLADQFGEFDYIIAHGVYSWVPPAVQEKLLEVCARLLAPDGIAYVSYNTLPGCGIRGVIRDAMRYHTRQFPDASSRARQARATLDFMAQAMEGAQAPYAMMVRSEAEQLRRKDDYYLLHDHLEEFNEALFFHQFADRAARHRLAFLAEADFRMMVARGLAPEAAHALDRMASGILEHEQFIDFLHNRSFRQTLLVRDARPIDRTRPTQHLASLWVASAARAADVDAAAHSAAPQDFRMPDGSWLRLLQPISKAAMSVLAARWPAAVPFADLCAMAAGRLGRSGDVPDAQRDALALDLWQGFTAGVVELHAVRPAFVVECGDRPQAGLVPRLQASRGPHLTNLRHGVITLDDADLQLLGLLDGSRTRGSLAAEVYAGVPDAEATVDQALARLARQALLVQ